jgi:hypothetical protein
MPLKMRPSGLGRDVYKDVPDYGVFRGEWCIGRIYETRAGPAEARWFWALHAPSKPPASNTRKRSRDRCWLIGLALSYRHTSWSESP